MTKVQKRIFLSLPDKIKNIAVNILNQGDGNDDLYYLDISDLSDLEDALAEYIRQAVKGTFLSLVSPQSFYKDLDLKDMAIEVLYAVDKGRKDQQREHKKLWDQRFAKINKSFLLKEEKKLVNIL